jgi:citrate lyase subunit beta/citryl-CoA lyase
MVDLAAIRAEIAAARARHAAVPEGVRGALVPYARRGELSIPAFRMARGGDPAVEGRAASMRMLGKAAELPVDFFFFDLEDAAPDDPDFKPWARRFAIEALLALDFGRRIRAFRPNNIRTPWFEDDVVEVLTAAGDRVDVLVLPKTETWEEVRDVQAILRSLARATGRDRPLWIEVLVESPRALLQADRIAALPDVTALIFGSWDFARSLGGVVDSGTWLQDQAAARQWLPIVAAAAGKDAVDAVTATLPVRLSDASDDAARALHERALALARRDAADARRLGYAAKWILHPDQVDPIQGAWTPSRERALDALALAARYASAAREGSGALVEAGQLADKAVVGGAWWDVRAGLLAGVIAEADIAATGFTRAALERSVRTRDPA